MELYLVGLAVAGHSLRDGRGGRGLVQVRVVIVQQELVSQGVQLWREKNKQPQGPWSVHTPSPKVPGSNPEVCSLTCWQAPFRKNASLLPSSVYHSPILCTALLITLTLHLHLGKSVS